MFDTVSSLFHTILLDPVWTLFPNSEGGAEVLLALGFIVLTLILLMFNRKTRWPIAVVYLIAVLYFTLLVRTAGAERSALLTPFHTIRNAIGWDGWFVIISKLNFYQLIANVLLFVPFGYLLPTLFRFAKRWYVVLPFGALASLGIELTQYFCRLGLFDIDDVISNTLGALIGFLLYRLLLKK